MLKVTIEGWEQGLNKVELNHLLRRHARYGLGEAKRAVDRVLVGESVSFSAADEESARAFCSSARAIGAHCSYIVIDVQNASLA
jgi:hypothetical protein